MICDFDLLGVRWSPQKGRSRYYLAMKVHVSKWVHDFGIISLNLTPKVVSGGSFVRCPNHGSDLCAAKDRIRGKSEELVFDNFQQTVKLGVPAGEGGTVGSR